ncbi:DUF6153 family protein [Actinomadura rudentiformis]|uniref:DUF6153 family protein n=1 Tax=Actinomadura rudentiformis TaxID=359158 RepID=UPI001CEF62AF
MRGAPAPTPISGRLGGSSRLLLALAVICGVMAMHGLQASNSPGDTSGMPAIGVEQVPAGHGGSGHRGSDLGGSDHGGAHDGGTQSGGAHAPEHHPGGEICLALLVLASFAVLLRAAWRAWRPVVLIPRSNVRPRPPDAGRSPPPPAFRSAVLRL